mgnify:CR=1 FL=1
MRPLKLTMSAFGPYKGEQVIDFTKLKQRNIFLITGPTGAGKTTIFDGISFAIFGKASGSDRDGENLRSDFADENTLTFVELEFELKGKKYSIKRTPKQLKKKSRGEGFTEQKSEVELRYQRGAETKIISGVFDVNESINSILGISYDQFRQIIMIPQGEFRELLTADSQKREDILQKIFGTQDYRKIQEILKDMANLLRTQAEDLKNRRAENIKKIDFCGNLDFKELCEQQNPNIIEIAQQLITSLAQDKENVEKIKLVISQADKEIVEKQRRIFSAIENNKSIALRDKIEAEKNLLKTREPEFEQRKVVLVRARKASTIIGLEENFKSRQEKAVNKEKEFRNVGLSFIEVQKKLKIAEDKFLIEKNREDQKNKLVEKKVKLTGYLEKVESLEILKKDYQGKEVELSKLGNEKQNTKSHIEKLRLEIKTQSAKLEEARVAASLYLSTNYQLEKQTQTFDKLKNLNQELLTQEILKSNCKQKFEQKSKEDKQFQRLSIEFENKQKLFFKGQAGFMAEALSDGGPCPVCGSINHPKPAQKPEGLVSENDLKTIKGEMELSDKRYTIANEVYNKLEAQAFAKEELIKSKIVELAKEEVEKIIDLKQSSLKQYLVEKCDSSTVLIKSLKQSILVLGEKKQYESQILEILKKKNKSLEVEELLLEKCDQEYEIIFGEVKVQKGNLDAIVSEIPQNVSSLKELTAKVAAVEEELTLMKQNLDRCEQLYSELIKVFERVSSDKTSCEKALKEAKEDINGAQVILRAAVTNAGFSSFEDYIGAKLTENKVDALETSITLFNESLKSAQDRFKAAVIDTNGLKVEDENIFKNELATLITKKEEINEKKENKLFTIKNNTNVSKSISDLSVKLSEKENKYSVIGDLANTSRGFNSEKITFERYVLAAFFDDIIDAANLRLIKMTSSRFELSRILTRTKGNAQSGLELEVFDNYTGKARHVKTLSGGESFKASLAMALGLADVVQSYAGGISLDTIFIDEGFGTLDPESLDGAIECLIELQNSGRLVGIISHVPELKQRIDARLEIEPGKLGSTAKFNIL